MIRALCLMFVLALPLVSVVSCNVAPKADDRESFVVEAREGLKHFESNVPGLKDQIKNSAGYAVFPGAGQWGIIFTGGNVDLDKLPWQ